MPLINLNGLDCEGSSSMYFLSPTKATIASRLKSLEAVTVTCNFLNDSRLIRCVLNFIVSEIL